MKIIENKKLLEQYVRRHDFYSLFDSDVAPYVELLYYRPKEYLIQDGKVSEYLLFLVDGECRFFTIAPNGVYISFGSAKDFEVFGEVSSLWGLKPANSVQAVTATYCLGFKLQDCREMLLNDTRFLRYLCQLIASRVTISNEALTSYVSVKAESRLANYIVQHTDSGRFTASLNLCSEAIGISYRHLIRLINSFCQQGILRKENRRYYIQDSEKLFNLTTDQYFTM